MPTPLLQKISKQNNIPLLELESIWSHAKDESIHKFKSPQWAWIVIRFKQLTEKKYSIKLSETLT